MSTYTFACESEGVFFSMPMLGILKPCRTSQQDRAQIY